MKKVLSVFFIYCLLPVSNCLLLLSLPKNAHSQTPQSWTSAEMYLALQKLNVLGSVLYIAAHPDDENTRLITYLSKDKLYRTGYLSITRGDGGQNLIGNEQGIELGLIRTQELLAARRIDGGEQFFTRAYDFGYSKNPEETFTKWDKEKILSDVVWVIRKFQPDVIITRFPTTGEGGHGHHTGSAILANEAFTAAADINRFPEQLKYVQPWQVKRVLWNTFNFGGNNLTRDDQFKIDVGGYNPLLGKSYGEISAEGRSQHKSQGFGVPASRGESLEYFKAINGTQPKNDLLEDVDISWGRVSGGAVISKMIDSLSASFDFLHPEKTVKGLVRLYKELNRLPDGYWKTQKLKETQQLIEQCSGLFIEATASQQFAVQTDSIRINFSINNRLGAAISLKDVSTDGFDSTLNQTLVKNQNVNFRKTIYVPASKSITQPYWLENKMEEGYFNVSDQQKIGQPDVDPAYTVSFTLDIEGQDLRFSKLIKYKFTDPVNGELYQPVVIVPVLNVSSSSDLSILRIGQTWNEGLVYRANKNLEAITILGENNNTVVSDNIALARGQSREWSRAFDIASNSNTSQQNKSEKFEFNYFQEPDGKSVKSFHAISYDHIPMIHYFSNTSNKFLLLDAKTVNKRIGYIIGAGDKVPEALEQMGYEVTLLTDKELSRNNLKQFDAIITGVRAYNTNEWMSKHYDKLMKYVNDGGSLIVQYNTNNFISSVPPKIGPYNFNISRTTRITDENAPVTFLKPNHPVLNFPNRITQNDFKGWVQERSIYHASAWDSTKFETVLSLNDPGEKPDEGSLIIAKYGKGVFVYTGIVFFRELPAGVPGAYRLLANIIALNKKKVLATLPKTPLQRKGASKTSIN